MRFKLNALLQESLFTSKAAFSHEQYYKSNFPMEDIAREQFTKQMAQKIIQVKGQLEPSINKDTNQLEISCQLLVFNPEQFKLIVEHTIKELSDKQIQEIKNGTNINT